MQNSFNNNFAAIFGDVIRVASNSQKIIEDCTVRNERRIYNDEPAFADRAEWMDSHQIAEERRKPVNIATVCNHDEECLRRIAAAGGCTCEQHEVEGAP